MKSIQILTAIALAASLSFAADIEKKDETKANESKNPFTGTVTKKKKHMKKDKTAAGETTSEVTEKTKTHTDGKVEKSVETEHKSEQH